MSWRNFLTPNDDKYLGEISSSKKREQSPIIISSIHFRDGSDKSIKYFPDKSGISDVHKPYDKSFQNTTTKR